MGSLSKYTEKAIGKKSDNSDDNSSTTQVGSSLKKYTESATKANKKSKTSVSFAPKSTVVTAQDALLSKKSPIIPITSTNKEVPLYRKAFEGIMGVAESLWDTASKVPLVDTIKKYSIINPANKGDVGKEFAESFDNVKKHVAHIPEYIEDVPKNATYAGGKFVEGAISIPQAAIKASELVNAQLFDPIENAILGNGMKEQNERIKQDSLKSRNMYQGWINSIDNKLPEVGKEAEFVGGVVQSIPQMSLNLIPGVGPALFGITAGGGYAQDAEAKGANEVQQLAYGTIGGIGEMSLNKVLNIVPGYKNLIGGSVEDFGRSMLKQAGKEAIEEASIDPVMGVAEKAIYNPNKQWLGTNGVIDPSQMTTDAAGGALLSVMLGALGLPAHMRSRKLAEQYVNNGTELTPQETQEILQSYKEDTGNSNVVDDSIGRNSAAEATLVQPEEVTIQPSNNVRQKSQEEIFSTVIQKQQNILDDLIYQRDYLGVDTTSDLDIENKVMSEVLKRRDEFIKNREAAKQQAEDAYRFENGIMPINEIMSKSEQHTEPVQAVSTTEPIIHHPEHNTAVNGTQNIIEKPKEVTVIPNTQGTNENKKATILSDIQNKDINNVIPTSDANIGKSGATTLAKWARNEYFTIDTNDNASPRSQAFIKMFNKFYNTGKNGGRIIDVKLDEDEFEFAPFVHQEFYNAGRRDTEQAQRKAETSSTQKTSSGDVEFPVGTNVEAINGDKYRVDSWKDGKELPNVSTEQNSSERILIHGSPTNDIISQHKQNVDNISNNLNSVVNLDTYTSSETGKTYEIPSIDDIKYSVKDGTITVEEGALNNIDKKDRRGFIKAFADKNYLTTFNDKGKIIKERLFKIKSDNSDILITQTGINDVSKKIRGGSVKSNDLELSMLVLPTLIVESKYTSSEIDKKDRNVSWRYYSNSCIINNRNYDVKISIRCSGAGDRYYYHSLEKIIVELKHGTLESYDSLSVPNGSNSTNDIVLQPTNNINSIHKKDDNNTIVDSAIPAVKVASWVKERLSMGKPFSFLELSGIANKAYGGSQSNGTYTSKDAYDAMELGINQYLLEQKDIDLNVDSAKQVKENVKKLRKILELVPTQTKGNSEQQQFQQFSTPPNVAYVTSWLADTDKNDTVFEPSAGIGGLAVFAKVNGVKVIVNELSERRLEVLKNMPFDGFFNENAEHINDILHNKVKPSIIIMNPPFSATAGRMGNKNSTTNAKMHIEQALEILQDNGRLVAITGQGMSDNAPAFSEWWDEIKGRYNVRANVGLYADESSGTIKHTTEYKKYGTDFGVQIIVIDKIGETSKTNGKYDTITSNKPALEDIVDLLEGIRNDRQEQTSQSTVGKEDSGSQPDSGSSTVRGSSGESGRNSSSGRVISDTADNVGQRERSSDGSERQPTSESERNGGSSSTSGTKANSGIRGTDRRDDKSGRNEGAREDPVETGEISLDGIGRGTDRNASDLETINVQNKKKDEQINKVNEDAVYSEYEPQKVKIKGAKPHASQLVQSTAMASVVPPDINYTPNIPKDLIESAKLSLAQLESIVYAGMQHSKKTADGLRKAFFIGDGTGVGKGRQISGIILDNWNQGRKKAIWISKNKPLFSDAVRDWTALGGEKGDVFSAAANKPIERKNGILFTTYSTLPNGQEPNKKTGRIAELNRLDQIVNWLGNDYDGVIVFDEAHEMQSAGEDNPAKKAIAGVKLQEMLPNARIVYASATGATEVSNLAYATRLGLWGKSTPFGDVNDFVGKIKAGGLAAMELVARDMKAMGCYIARNISFMGVKYSTTEHTLTNVQREIYDSMAEGWQVVLQNIEKYLKYTGADKNAKRKTYVMQNFWSTQQRFFNQILTSMQMPTVIEDMKKRLTDGNACVLQLVNTNAAAEEREVSRIEEEGGSLDDMDITPKGSLLEMIDKCFPTQKFEEYVDDNGKKQTREVKDSEGNPVEDATAVRAKESLIQQIDQMQVPNSPMDMILQEFGVENVTEVTGRPRRFVFKRNKFGEPERQEEGRSDKVVEADVNDFINDKKQILIFSDAGGTGKSYHAGKEFKNQRKRIHYLIQAGWNASKAVQGFGRTHRTNQVSAPEYVLVTTNLKGQKRFISSIARRLDQLGALTKGQRQTGSSGLFSAKDNLEGKEAKDALELFYRQLVNGQIPGLKAKALLQKMGLTNKILVKEQLTTNIDDLRDVTRFLNRILVLKADEQNHVFDEFMRRVDYIVEEAIRNDRLDTGLENYKSAGAVVTDEQNIHKDSTGAETKYIAITAKQKAYFYEHNELSANEDYVGFFKSIETGEVRAAIKAVDKTNADGSITKTYYMQSPMVGKRSHIVEKSFNDKWEKIDRKDEKRSWIEETNKEPKFREEKLHLISGALLPIWDRLPSDYARVIRITADDGNSYLGRLIPTHQIDETLRILGVSREKESFDLKGSINKVLKENKLIRLVNRTTIVRAKVAGEYRLELDGDNTWSLARSYPEIFSEKIGSKWRYFIPVGEKGYKILEQITQNAPILEVVDNRKVESEVQGYSVQGLTGKDTTTMPKGNDSSTESKTVDDLITIIEKRIGVPIRTGKFNQRAYGIFKIKPEVIRTKVRGDMPVISHEFGHYLDKKYSFSNNSQFDNEIIKLGRRTSKSSYDKQQVRAEGIAEFVRLYLTDPAQAYTHATQFMAHFEKTLDNETIKFMSMLRKEIAAIINLPANKKIWNDVSDREGRKSNNKSVNMLQKFYDAWINEQGAFTRLEREAEKKGWAGKNIDIMSQTYKGFEAKALNMLFDKQRDLSGNIVGESMMDILAPISRKQVRKRNGNPIQERKDFITYMIARRAMDYKSRGLVMPQAWYVYEDNIVDMEAKFPHFIDVFDRLRRWEDNNLQLLVDSGIKAQEDIEVIKYMNANHVPLYRVREAAEAIRAGGGNTIGQSKEVVKRAIGSGATIIDPLESMIVDSFIIRRASESNNVMGVMYDMAESLDGMGNAIEKVPARQSKTSFVVSEIRGQMLKSANAEIADISNQTASAQQAIDLKHAEDYKKAIEDMTDEELESVMSVYRPLYTEKDNEVTVYRNGKKHLMQVDPELHKAIKGLNREQMNIIMRALNSVKKINQAGIVTSVPFVLRNVARDMGTSLIQSEAGINPIDIIAGYKSAAAKDKWFHEWVAAGGATEYVNVNNRRQAQKVEDDLLGVNLCEKAAMFIEAMSEVKRNNNVRTRSKLLNSANMILDVPFDAIRDAVDVSESGARIAEFRKAVKKGVDKETAAAWSRKLSVDFLRHGYTGKQVNAVVAFFNANLQGIVRMGETMAKHPARTFIKGFAYITLPTLLLYYFNHDDDDYKNLPEWRRAMFWNIPIGNSKFLMIPKPPGYGWIFGAAPEFALDKVYHNDPKMWDNLKSTFIQSFQLPTEVSATGPMSDVLRNKSWSNTPIESASDQNRPAYLRRNEKTSILSRAAGDILKNENGISPKQIDYLVKGYLGTVGDFFWRLPDGIKSGAEDPSDVTRWPVVKSFVTDSVYSTNASNSMYEYRDELTKRLNEFKEVKKYTAIEHLPEEKRREIFGILEEFRLESNRVADNLSDGRAALKTIEANDKFTPTVKAGKQRQIRSIMNKKAQDFNSKYEKFKQSNGIK